MHAKKIFDREESSDGVAKDSKKDGRLIPVKVETPGQEFGGVVGSYRTAGTF